MSGLSNTSNAHAPKIAKAVTVRGSYAVAPDLFLERLERTHIEGVVADLLRRDALIDDWLVAPKDNALAET
jgi:hypothetical protein